MQPALYEALRARRQEIHARWEALLRVERATTALAHPDTLVYLIDWSLDEIFRALLTPPANRARVCDCSCGRNPYVMYYHAGEQAMHEALVLTQFSSPALNPLDRDQALRDLKHTLEHLSYREIQAFCAVCQFHHAAPAGEAPAAMSTLPLAN